METERPAKKAKRERKDTFWCYSNKENAKYFDDIYHGKSDAYEIRHLPAKLDYEGNEQICWQLYSRKTNSAASTIRSTKPYRISMIWAVYTDSFWTAQKREKTMSLLPKIVGKRGDHSKHRCGRDWCCNPDHIVIGSRTSNEVDKHFHYFLNHSDPQVSQRFRETFADMMKDQDVW